MPDVGLLYVGFPHLPLKDSRERQPGKQPEACHAYPGNIAEQHCTERCSAEQQEQGQAIGQHRDVTDDALSNNDGNPRPDRKFCRIEYPIDRRSSAQQGPEIMAAAPALFMATPATASIHAHLGMEPVDIGDCSLGFDHVAKDSLKRNRFVPWGALPTMIRRRIEQGAKFFGHRFPGPENS